VKTSDWFYGDVEYAHKNGLFVGTSATTFEPSNAMTRAMLVTVLWRMQGCPSAGGRPFTDVADDLWYFEAVAWAAAEEIVIGIGGGLFSPEADISRQDMAVMLMRYIDHIGYKYAVDDDYRLFADEEAISDYAKNAVQNLNKLGVIYGRGNGVIDPRGKATRAEVAAMLHRLLELIK
jgi:hypothetical protein